MGHFLAGLLGKLCVDELRAWLPKVALRLTRIAVRILPEDQRERYDEEWRSHLDDAPGALTKLGIACGFLCAAIRVTPRRRALTEGVLFYAIAVLLLPLIGVVSGLRVLNSRRCYSVPLILNLSTRDARITVDRIPVGLALRFALASPLNLDSLNLGAYHYSLWWPSRFVELENFMATRLGLDPFLSFGTRREPLRLSWGSVRVLALGTERREDRATPTT